MSDAAPTSAAARPALHLALSELADVPFADSLGDEVYFPPRDRYLAVAKALKRVGFVSCSDLCGVDYLTNPERPLPEGVARERFEIVATFLSIAEARRVRLRVMVSEEDPTMPSLFPIYPGTENMEREAYDMFGVSFEGHPDPTRILMPEDWEGHPLRRDYGMGRVPVQFKDAPGPR